MRIGIIGGGASAICTLYEIVKQMIAAKIAHKISEITVFEKSNVLARGLAYSHPNILNMPNGTMSIDTNRPLDFVLRKQVLKDNFAKRLHFGDYLVEWLLLIRKKVEAEGIRLNLLTNSKVIDVEEQEATFRLQTASAKEYICDKLILCIGNQPPTYGLELIGKEGYFHKAYDIDAILNKIPPNEHVVILGAGLTAIDTYLSLRDHGHKGAIKFVSRTGLLPKVRGSYKPYDLKHLSPSNLKKLTKNGVKKLSFSKAVNLFLKEVGISASEIEKAIKQFHELPQRAILRRDIEAAALGKTSSYFSVLVAINNVARIIWNSMREDAQKYFGRHCRRFWNIYAYPMPPVNASKILHALENNRLSIFSGLKSVHFDHKLQQFTLQLGDSPCRLQTVKSKWLVNATGPGIDITQTIDPLLRKLQERNSIAPHPMGGIKVIFESGQVIRPDGICSKNFYVIGHLTQGVHFYTNSLAENSKAAARLACNLVQDIKSSAMFITAAPVGAVPKYIDPCLPRFFSKKHVDLFRMHKEKLSVIKDIEAAGWEQVQEKGLTIQIFNIAPGSKGTVSDRLPILEREALEKISDKRLQRKLTLQLTNQGWQFNQRGDLTWPHGNGQSYLPPKYLKEFEAKYPNFLLILRQMGWEDCGEGYWRPGKGMTPYLPIQPEDIVQQACDAAIVHLHTRNLTAHPYKIPGSNLIDYNRSQANSIQVNDYLKIVPHLFDHHFSLILNLSTSIRGAGEKLSHSQRCAHLKSYGVRNTVPDICSLSPGPVIFQDGGGYDNPPTFIREIAKQIKESNIRPEIEIFNKIIAENINSIYKDLIRDLGTPPIFMLVVGVDQYKYLPERLDKYIKNEDVSLIPRVERERIFRLLSNGGNDDKKKAVEVTCSYLYPILAKLREAHADAIVSILMRGPMQEIITDVGIKLGLEGIRVGLEDGLNVVDANIPGQVRAALNTADQVKRVRVELESQGISLISSEQLRDKLGIMRDEVKLFRELEAATKKFTIGLPDTEKIPKASVILNDLSPQIAKYVELENQFVANVLDNMQPIERHPEKVAFYIWDLARKHGIFIRFFFEEAERYDNPSQFISQYSYVIQPLNFIRELLYERELGTSKFDKLLSSFKPEAKMSRFISKNQFKGLNTRFLEFCTGLSSQYNQLRTCVINTEIRQDSAYSATMTVLYAALEEQMINLRKKSKVREKRQGTLWYELVENDEKERKLIFRATSRSRLQEFVKSGGWICLPSTPTTNYDLGIGLAQSLLKVMQRFVTKAIVDYSKPNKENVQARMLVGIHTGLQPDGQAILEATMLKTRFASNTDINGELTTYSTQQLYDQLILPRIVKKHKKLAYDSNGLVARSAEGLPLYADGSSAKRIASAQMYKVPLLKMIGHSSGIVTAQLIDNAMRKDMKLLGFSSKERRYLFHKSFLIHLGSAGDIHTAQIGTPVIDLTASNDIRSIAGTTTKDYTEVDPSKLKDFASSRSKDITFDNNDALVKIVGGNSGRILIRYKNVFLSEDPQRLHDGHSIKCYTQEAPEHLRAVIAMIEQQNHIRFPQQIITQASKMQHGATAL